MVSAAARRMIKDMLFVSGTLLAVFVATWFGFGYLQKAVTDAGASVAGGAWRSDDTAAGEDPVAGFRREAHIRAGHNGHFTVEAYINGRAVEVLVDTGATGVSLTYEDAERIGIFLRDSDYTHYSRTANGIAKIAPVELDEIRIGDVSVRNVSAYVGEPGKMFSTLLGMTFLSRLERVDIRGNELVLVE